jgi:hypothetical protein
MRAAIDVGAGLLRLIGQRLGLTRVLLKRLVIGVDERAVPPTC